MFTQESFETFSEEVRRLNHNLEVAHQDSLRTSGELRSLNEHMRVLGVVSKRLGIFNQIMLQVRKSAGNAGMIHSIFEGFIKMAQSAR